MRRPARPPASLAGFTLLEAAVAMSVIGVLALVTTSAYSGYADVRARARAEAQAETARHALRTFALKNKRLPCPDRSAQGDGAREGLAGACPTGAQVGWLPYESLGLVRPDRADRMRYAVSRGVGADLVAPATSTADIDFDGNARLRRTLADAAVRAPGSDRPYVTGRGTPLDAESCSRVVANPAFVLVAPVRDRDGAGGIAAGFDGLNQAMATGNALCIAAPGRPMDANYDDVVVAEGVDALLGWLSTHTR